MEKASDVVLGAVLRIDTHSYGSDGVVANCRYDVLLEMPWHVANSPQIYYVSRTVKADNKILPLRLGDKHDPDTADVVSMGV